MNADDENVGGTIFHSKTSVQIRMTFWSMSNAWKDSTERTPKRHDDDSTNKEVMTVDMMGPFLGLILLIIGHVVFAQKLITRVRDYKLEVSSPRE